MKVYLAKAKWDGASYWQSGDLECVGDRVLVWPTHRSETHLPLIDAPKEFWATLVRLGYAKGV